MNETPDYITRRRRGLTLIELMVATLLAAILMWLLTGVLRSVTRQQKWVMREAAGAPTTSIIVEQLRRDLSNARRLESTANSLLLEGLLAEDAATHLPSQRPAQVRYTIEPVAGTTCLVRTVVEQLEGRGRVIRRAPVWLGAASIKTQRFNAPAISLPEEAELSPSGEAAKPAANQNAMPSRAEVVVLDKGGHVLCRVDAVR